MARAERIARPTRSGEWEVVAADKSVADDWDRWARQEPNALASAYDQLATNPTQFSSRQKRLEAKTYGTGTYDGKTYDRWQYEATAGGRIFYFVRRPDRRRPQEAGAKGQWTKASPTSHHRRSIPATRRRPSASADEISLRRRRAPGHRLGGTPEAAALGGEAVEGAVGDNHAFAGQQILDRPFPTELDHFKCYRAFGKSVDRSVDLRDQFRAETVKVLQPLFFCNPTQKLHAGQVSPIRFPDAHLTCYRTTFTPFTAAVVARNQFGVQDLSLTGSELLCVPSLKRRVTPQVTTSTTKPPTTTTRSSSTTTTSSSTTTTRPPSTTTTQLSPP